MSLTIEELLLVLQLLLEGAYLVLEILFLQFKLLDQLQVELFLLLFLGFQLKQLLCAFVSLLFDEFDLLLRILQIAFEFWWIMIE